MESGSRTPQNDADSLLNAVADELLSGIHAKKVANKVFIYRGLGISVTSLVVIRAAVGVEGVLRGGCPIAAQNPYFRL